MSAAEKIAVLHVALNPVTGPWSVMRELAKAQAGSGLYAGVGVGVITYRDWGEQYQAELDGLELPVFRAFTPKMFGTASFVWQRIQKPPFAKWIADFANRCAAQNIIVHFHNAWMSGVFLPLPPSKNKRLAAIATFHGVNAFLEGQPMRHRLHRWMAQRLLRAGAKLTSVDAANLSRAETMFGLPADKFQVVPNGVTATDLRACPFLRGDPRFTVGHVGSLIPQKGWDIATHSVIAAARSGISCRMIIAGAGPDEAQARDLAKANPGIIEFRGFVRDPRRNLLPELDLLAVMSSHEGLPMSAVEALSVGLPVAGTAVGGMPEAVENGQTGFLVERSSNALEKIISNLAADRPRLQQLSDSSLEHFKSRFEISIIVAAYHDVYSSALFPA